MGIATTIGLDIAKSVFQVHGVDAAGEVVIRRKLTRGRVLGLFENLPRCLVGSRHAAPRTIGPENWLHEAMMCSCFLRSM